MMDKKIILASGSVARRNLLAQAGLEFEAITSGLDETEIISSLHKKVSPEDLAHELAMKKALMVSAQHKDAYVIGGDQILVQDGEVFEKVDSREAAIAKLKLLSGRTHQLISAMCVVDNNEVIWEHIDSVRLTMKDLTVAQIESYVDAAGESILDCVGCYQLEGLGVWLFEKIEGSYFTILGMPLLPLLRFLELKGGGPWS